MVHRRKMYSMGVQGQLELLRQRWQIIYCTSILMHKTTILTHQMTHILTNIICVALYVKVRSWPIPKQLYWFVVKGLGSWRLRSSVIQWNTDVSWQRAIYWKLYHRNIFRSRFWIWRQRDVVNQYLCYFSLRRQLLVAIFTRATMNQWG